MSRERSLASAGWARAFNVLAPPADDVSIAIDVDTLVEILEALPSYAEITLTFIISAAEHLGRREYDLMARDIPGPGRRFTCLTTGTEWLDIAGILVSQDAEFITATKRNEEQPMLFVSL